jgi:transposase
MRRSLKSKRDEQEFRAAETQLKKWIQRTLDGEIDLYYCDESGFTLEPVIHYAWTDKGETLEIPSASSDRLNVVGFLGINQQFHSFVFEDSINSEIAIACFDYLSQRISKATLVVIDRAPIHTSDDFIAHLKDWEERGLYVYLLPAYSPELNLIEILWRKIKYEWLPLSAYLSFDLLKKALASVLKQLDIGENGPL